MPTTIDQYREAKMTFFKLRDQAKKDLLARFHELSNELLGIQRELRDDFGVKISIPTKPKPGRAKKTAMAKPTAPTPAPAPKPDPRVAGLTKSLASQKKKLEVAKEAGKPLKAIQDRIYELEDELRLASQQA